MSRESDRADLALRCWRGYRAARNSSCKCCLRFKATGFLGLFTGARFGGNLVTAGFFCLAHRLR
jgi:hypothetical protein